LVSVGDLAKENLFRFSTKPVEDNTGLSLYEIRPYGPSWARWLSRDPIGEEAFFRQFVQALSKSKVEEWALVSREPEYLFVHNTPLNNVDPNGLTDRPWPINGRVKVDKGCKKTIKSVDIDNKKVYLTNGGESTPWAADVDFVEVDGTWYKIGAANFKVGACCEPDKGFRKANAGELRDIAAITED